MKIKKIALTIFIFIFIISLLLWSVPVWGADSSIGGSIKPPNYALSEIFQREMVKVSDMGIDESKILPSSPLYFFSVFSQAIDDFFIFDRTRQAERKMQRMSEKLIETRQLVFQREDWVGFSNKTDKLSNQINKTLRMAGKRSDKVKDIFLDLIANNSARVEQDDLLDKLALNFLNWQEILSEIAFLGSVNFPAESNLAREIWQANNRDFAILLAGSAGPTGLAQRLEVIMEKSPGGLFKSLRHLEIFLGIKDTLGEQLVGHFLFLEKKLKGEALGEILTARQIDQSDKNYSFTFPFLSPALAENILLNLKKESGREDWVEKFSRRPLDKIYQEEAIACIDNFRVKTEGRLKELEEILADLSLTGRKELLILVKEAQDRLEESKTTLEEKNCLLAMEAAERSNLAKTISLLSQTVIKDDFLRKINLVVVDSQKMVSKLVDDDLIRPRDILNELELKEATIKNSLEKNDWANFFSKLSEFWAEKRNLDFALDLINYSTEKKYLGQRELLNKENKENFSRRCWEERGFLSGQLFLWPQCLLPTGEVFYLNRSNNKS